MEPAGEMWSVVMESPNKAMMRAPCTPAAPKEEGCMAKPSKKGGRAI